MSTQSPNEERPVGSPIPVAGASPCDLSTFPFARWTAFAAVGLLALVVFVYRGVWDNAFYQDDYLWLDIARGMAASPATIFVADPDNSEALVRMTQRMVMGLVFAGFGSNAAAHHLASLLLHGVASTLVFRLLLELHLRWGHASRRLALAMAAAGAVVFATTHHHAMAVLWVAAQSGLLAAIAICLLVLALIRARDLSGDSRAWWRAVLLFLLALYSKNTAVGIALVILGGFVLAPFGALPPRARRAGMQLSALLVGVGIVHLVFTKWVLVQWTAGELGNNFAVSSVTLLNVLGAMLAPFLSAGDTTQRIGASIPYPLLSLVWLGSSLGLARWGGVLRPVLWGWLWIVLLTLPVCFMDFELYDVVQFTVSRYFYGAMIGAAIVLSFLARGVFERLHRPAWGWAALLLLLALHTGHHQRWVQHRSHQFHEKGVSDLKLIEATLRQARQRVPAGSKIYAVGWPMDDVFVRRFGRLHLEGTGYELEGEAALPAAVRERRMAGQSEPWVALVEAEKQRFGVVPHSVYERALTERRR